MFSNPCIREGSIVRLKGEGLEHVGVVKQLLYSVCHPYGKALVQVGSFTLDFPLDRLELVVNRPDDLFE